MPIMGRMATFISWQLASLSQTFGKVARASHSAPAHNVTVETLNRLNMPMTAILPAGLTKIFASRGFSLDCFGVNELFFGVLP